MWNCQLCMYAAVECCWSRRLDMNLCKIITYILLNLIQYIEDVANSHKFVSFIPVKICRFAVQSTPAVCGFTPFRIEDAQYATPSSLITAHKVGVLNEKRCKSLPISRQAIQHTLDAYDLYRSINELKRFGRRLLII